MARDPRAKFVIEAERRGAQAFTSLQSDFGKLIKTVAGITAAFVGLRAAQRQITDAFDRIDSIAKTSDAIGVATEKLVGFQLAAKITGVDSEQLNKGLLRMQKTVFDASQGLSSATRALDLLGLSTRDMLGMSADQQFTAIAKAMEGMENATMRSGAASQIFGARNVAILKTLDLGAEGLQRYTDEAERFGTAVTRVDAAKIEQANDAITRAGELARGTANVVAVELAPVISGLVNNFIDAAGGAEQMRDRVVGAIDIIATSVGIVGDAIHGWQLLLIEAEKALHSFAIFSGVDRRREETDELLAQLGILEQVNAAAVFSVPVHQEKLRALEAQKQALLDGVKPSQRIAEWLAEARANAQAAAEETARLARQALDLGGADTGETEDERRARETAEREAQRLREQLERNLEQVRTFTLSREEIEIEAHARRLEILRNAFEQELIDKERFDELSIEVAQRTQDRLTEIAKEGWTEREKFAAMSSKAQTAHVLDSLVEMTQGVATHNKAMFRINQAAAIARAVVNVAEGVTKALSAYPPPLSFIMAAAQAAAGAAQISAIRSATFGGGTTPSVAGSVPTHEGQPVQPFQPPREQARAPTVLNINIQGGLADRETGIEIAEVLRDLIDNYDVEIMGQSSSQASKIRLAG